MIRTANLKNQGVVLCIYTCYLESPQAPKFTVLKLSLCQILPHINDILA